MEILIILTLAVAVLFLSLVNWQMSNELEVGKSDKVEDFKYLNELKRKLATGELIYSNSVANYIAQSVEKYKLEKEELEQRLDDVIIKADVIAGERAQNLLDRWKLEEEKNIRADAIKRSQNVIKGKVTEHIIPHLPEFKWNPQDARFLGTPLDYIIFEGLSEGNVTSVVFVEVKTGKSAKLSTRERQCRDAILDGRVTYEKIHIKQ